MSEFLNENNIGNVITFVDNKGLEHTTRFKLLDISEIEGKTLFTLQRLKPFHKHQLFKDFEGNETEGREPFLVENSFFDENRYTIDLV